MTLLNSHTALIVVDVQCDFCPGGALAVTDGDGVVPPLVRAIESFQEAGLPVIYTRDWHPPDHVSFEEQGGTWPPHCVAETPGAAFHPDLAVPPGAWIVSKATDRDEEAYSGFQGTTLAADLEERGVRRVLVGGLATDYCVRATVLDALTAGLEGHLLTDAVRAVNVKPDDGARAIRAMEDAGVRLATVEGINPSASG